jgi:ribosomal protein S10
MKKKLSKIIYFIKILYIKNIVDFYNQFKVLNIKNSNKIQKKIQFIFISNNQKYLDYYEIFFKKILTKFLITFKIIKLPLNINKITLLTSPHVNKKAQEHFCSKKYKLIFYINNYSFNNNFKLILLILKNKIKNIKFKIKISL